MRTIIIIFLTVIFMMLTSVYIREPKLKKEWQQEQPKLLLEIATTIDGNDYVVYWVEKSGAENE